MLGVIPGGSGQGPGRARDIQRNNKVKDTGCICREANITNVYWWDVTWWDGMGEGDDGTMETSGLQDGTRSWQEVVRPRGEKRDQGSLARVGGQGAKNSTKDGTRT